MRPWLVPLLPLLACGCARLGEPEALRLVRFQQAGEQGVFLNEPLVFHFSEELDPSSVNRETVRIVTTDGRPARGGLVVQRYQLRFEPDLPLASDLQDGGLLPGRVYEVQLLGFPAPDGLRSRAGAPLVQTFRSGFETVVPGREGAPAFVDETLDAALPLRLESAEIEPLEPIRLTCEEPLDPTTVHPETFLLGRYVPAPAGEGLDRLEHVQLRTTLVANGRRLARLELRPFDPTERVLRELEPGVYHLGMVPGRSRLADFGGHPVLPAWYGAAPIRVVPSPGGIGRELHVSFLSTNERSPVAVEGADGTAYWGETGEVSVRLPRAAGSGVDGAVRLGSEEARDDVHATRLVLEAGAQCDLAAPGLVVLRSQGSMRIEGSLRRRVQPPELERRSDETWAEWMRRVEDEDRVPSLKSRLPAAGEPRTLHRWLEAARAEGPAWTVLVAGGDLWVTGEIELDGPLLLVAGGQVRASGEIRAPEIAKVGVGGGFAFQPVPYAAPLVLEPPPTNPLREELLFAVMSAPLRLPQGASRWRSALVDGYAGAGRFRVRFVGERESPRAAVEVTEPVDDPAMLEDADAVRLLLELWVGPAELWDPPRIDFVELSWE